MPAASSFRNGLDVLAIRIAADHGDSAEAVIEQVFRGNEKAGPVAIRWDTSVSSYPQSAPADLHSGDRLIVLGGFAANQFFPQFVYRDSAEARRDLAANLPAGERIGWIQGISFLFLLLVPALQIALHSLYKRTRRRAHLIINLVLPITALLDYWFYESGIPAYINIRIDLLLLLPVAALTALLWVIFAVKDWNARPDAPHPEPR